MGLITPLPALRGLNYQVRPHRLSYLKTVLASLAVSLAALILAIYWLTVGQTRVPILGWILFKSSLFNWASIVAVVLSALFCLMVGVGGILALQRDARESDGG